MTQTEFNVLPLLLRRHQVCEILGWRVRCVQDFRADGDLRIFRPDPADPFAYYFRADLARITGRLVMDPGLIAGLPVWIRSGQFRHLSGLSEHSFYLAVKHGQLVGLRSRRRPQMQFYSKDLEWFL